MRNLFYFFDDYYLPIIIPIKFYKIERVVIIRERGKDNLEDYNDFKEYIQNEFENILIEEQVLSHYLDIEKIIKSFLGENYAYFDGEINLNELVVFNSNIKIKKVIISESKGIMYEFNQNEIIEHNIKNIDFRVEDLIKSFGGSIEMEQSHLYKSLGVSKLLDWIITNYSNWTKINERVFKRNTIFINDKKHRNSSLILKGKIDDYTEYILITLLNVLQENNYIDYVIDNNNLFINYKDLGLKEVMKKPGTWLEGLTFKILKEINKFNDIKIGIEFLWDIDNEKVRNELDVLAIKDQQVLCVSCKDTKRYGKESFNELVVYSEKLGGENAKSVLVATKLPEFNGDIERAKEMDIELIIFDGDIEKFKRNLKRIR